jgi:hypothetical protein
MKIIQRSRSTRRWGVAVMAAATLAVATTSVTSFTSPGDHDAVLVSASGNVIPSSDGLTIGPAAVYYHGFYATKAKCQAALKTKLASGQYSFGGCTLFNQYPHAGEWQLWLDEDTCTDRVTPTNGLANGLERAPLPFQSL